MKLSKILTVIGIPLIFILFVVLFKGIQRKQRDDKYSLKLAAFNQKMKRQADSINKICPVWLDDKHQALGVEILPNRTVKFKYAMPIDTSQVDIPYLEKLLREKLLREYIGESGKEFKELDVTLIHSYYDMNNHLLFDIKLTADIY